MHIRLENTKTLGARGRLVPLLMSCALAGCVAPEAGDDELVASAAEALDTSNLPDHGHFPIVHINEYNTRHRATIRYGQTLDRLAYCTMEVDRYPPAYAYRRRVMLCSVTFQGTAHDRVTVTLTNTDTSGTAELRAYLVDPSGRIVDVASFDAPDDGWNTGRAAQISLSGGEQLRSTGTYTIAFTKFLLPGAETAADAFTVSLAARRAQDMPLARANPPIRTGLYAGTLRNYYVEVLLPEVADEKHFGAWSARVYHEKLACGAPQHQDFATLRCTSEDACWFTTWSSYVGSGSPMGQAPPSTIFYMDRGRPSERLTWVREVSELERAGYENSNSCVIRCPSSNSTSRSGTTCDAGCRREAWLAVNRPWPGSWIGRCPLVLNVSGQRTISFLGSPVNFDLDGTGRTPLDWVRPEHPFVALDLDGNGAIDDGTELFGSATQLTASGRPALDGFEALAQYDENGDQTIDASDSVFPRLVLWFDRNSDGASAPSELSALMFSGVTSLSLRAEAQARRTDGRPFVAFSSTFSEHVCRPTRSMYLADVWFPSSEP